MAAINKPASIYFPHTNEKESRCQKILRVTTTEIPLFVDIPSQETGAYFPTSPKTGKISTGSSPQNPEKVRKIYRHLSPNSRKKLLSCSNNENMRALLGYIRKKRQADNSDKLPARRRRSFPKQAKRSSKRSKKSRRQNESRRLQSWI